VITLKPFLRTETAAKTGTAVMSLSNFMATVKVDRALSIHGYSLPPGQTGILLQADKLHPGPPGCAVLALLKLDPFQSTRPANTQSEIIWDPKKVFHLAYPSPQPSASSAAKPKTAEPAQPLGK